MTSRVYRLLCMPGFSACSPLCGCTHLYFVFFVAAQFLRRNAFADATPHNARLVQWAEDERRFLAVLSPDKARVFSGSATVFRAAKHTPRSCSALTAVIEEMPPLPSQGRGRCSPPRTLNHVCPHLCPCPSPPSPHPHPFPPSLPRKGRSSRAWPLSRRPPACTTP